MRKSSGASASPHKPVRDDDKCQYDDTEECRNNHQRKTKTGKHCTANNPLKIFIEVIWDATMSLLLAKTCQKAAAACLCC